MTHNDLNANTDYRKQYWKKYSKKNRKRLNEKENLRRKRIKEWLKNYKERLSCSRCSESENQCLDFHHVQDKKFTINFMVNNSYSIGRIEEEIEKCVVLCGNCHRVQHYENKWSRGSESLAGVTAKSGSKNNKRRRKLRILVFKIRSSLSCYTCDYSHPRVLDFHHIMKKLFGINESVHRALSKERIIAEIRKCIPLCVNCHRKIHNRIIEICVSEEELEEYWDQHSDKL